VPETEENLSEENLQRQAEINFLNETLGFFPVFGGPVFRFFKRSHLAGDGLERSRRRVVVIMLVTWLPLLLLATLVSSSGSVGRLSFLQDAEVHVRFLIALPVLIAAEVIVHSRMRPVVRQFIELRIVLPQDLPYFHRAIESAVRLGNSMVELGLLGIVYTLGLWLWHSRVVLAVPTWYANSGGRWNLTPAGFWYVFISIPILQFILLRWYLRLFIWFRLLWQVSRLDLKLIPTNPDRCAGLAFLGRSGYAFSPILFAQGAMLAGVIASRVLYRGESLLSFQLEIFGFVAFFVFAILGPLSMFTPAMARARRKGLGDYGVLGQQYVEDFEQKWIRRDPNPSAELLGTGDIQALADLANACAIVRDMRLVPFGLQDISRLAVATAAPMLPLLLTIISPEELILRMIKVVF
jgi:hypothetical protein